MVLTCVKKTRAWGVSALATVAEIPTARAGEHRISWEHREIGAGEVAYTVGAWASYGVVELLAESPPNPRWRGHNPIDDAARRAFVMSSRTGRSTLSITGRPPNS